MSPGRVYRSHTALRLSPMELRTTTFRRAPILRRGVRADDVHDLLLAVAAHLERLYHELAVTAEENERLKASLRDWQTRTRNPRRYRIPAPDPRDGG